MKTILTAEQAAKLGTLGHNTYFSPRDAREYGLTTSLRKLVRLGILEHVARGQYYLTFGGEQVIKAVLADKE